MEFGELVKQYGLPFAMMIFAGVSNYRGAWLWRSFLLAEEARHAETRTDRNFWRDTALHALGIATTTTTVLERQTHSGRTAGPS